MGLIIEPRETLQAYLRIALGGGETLVPQQFLHAAQVSASVKQMRGIGMAQPVRGNGHVKPGVPAECRQTARGLAPVQAAATRAHKQRGP